MFRGHEVCECKGFLVDRNYISEITDSSKMSTITFHIWLLLCVTVILWSLYCLTTHYYWHHHPPLLLFLLLEHFNLTRKLSCDWVTHSIYGSDQYRGQLKHTTKHYQPHKLHWFTISLAGTILSDLVTASIIILWVRD